MAVHQPTPSEVATVTICEKCEHVFQTWKVECPHCVQRAREDKVCRNRWRCFLGFHKMEVAAIRFGLARWECVWCGKERLTEEN